MRNQPKSLKEYVASVATDRQRPSDTSWLSSLRATFGSSGVLVDAETIDAYSYDTWPVATKWKHLGKRLFAPDAVIKANSSKKICDVLQWANLHNVPVTPWGGGSSVTGQALAVDGGIILDTTSMNEIIALDEESLLVKVEAGIFGHNLEKELNQRGYTLNHSPQSLDRSTVGGWLSTRAMGQFSSAYGGIEDLVVSFSVILPTGEEVETMHVPRAAVGPDLRHIFIGAEGTMGIITEVTLKIFPLAETRILEAISFDSVEAGIAVMRTITRTGLKPFLVRFYDQVEARHAMQDKDFNGCAMFLGFEGPQAVAQATYDAAMKICSDENGTKIGPAPVEAWMGRRFDFSTVEKLLDEPGGLAETIEVAHFWHGILDTYHALRKALAPYAQEVLGHFSHVYPQGTSLYIILLGHAADDAQAEEHLLEIWDTAMQICLKTGAVISHHHGSGLARLPYVQCSLGSSMQVLEKIKTAIDPANIMNPGKLGL